jgi:hypothetical protein
MGLGGTVALLPDAVDNYPTLAEACTVTDGWRGRRRSLIAATATTGARCTMGFPIADGKSPRPARPEPRPTP